MRLVPRNTTRSRPAVGRPAAAARPAARRPGRTRRPAPRPAKTDPSVPGYHSTTCCAAPRSRRPTSPADAAHRAERYHASSVEPGGVRRHRRAVGQRQDHAARPARRARPADRRHGPPRRPGARRARRGRARAAARREGRLRLPVLPAHPHPHRARERPGPARAARRGRRRPGRRAARAGGPRRPRRTTTRPSSPAASSSAWRWRARSARGPGSCSPTSPPATSTPPPAPRSSTSWPSSTATSAPRSCWSPTISISPRRARRTIRLADGARRRRHRRVSSPARFVLRMAGAGAPRGAPAAAPAHRLGRVGVAALVAIDSFTDNLRDSVREQAQALLGADLALSSRRPLAHGRGGGARHAHRARAARSRGVTSFSGMAYVPRTSGHAAGAGGGGRGAATRSTARSHRARGRVERAARRAAAWSSTRRCSPRSAPGVGDTLALGEARFVITGTVVSAPGNVGVRTAFGPRIYIPARDLAETQPARLRLPRRVRGVPAAARRACRRRPSPTATARRSRAERVRVRTVAEDQQRPERRRSSRLTGYLGLVALIALLLGGIGVASAVVVFIRQRLGDHRGAALPRRERGPGARASTCSRRRRWVSPAASSARRSACWRSGCCPACWPGLLPVDVAAGGLAGRRGARASAIGALGRAALRRAPAARGPPGAAARGAPPRVRARAAAGGSIRWRLAAAASLAASTVALAALAGRELAAGRGLRRRRRRSRSLRALGRGVAADPRRAALGSRALALRVAAGPRQPAPARQPDGHGRARHRLRRLPARHAVPGAGQPAPHAPAHRRPGAAQPGAVRHPARPAGRRSSSDARRRRATGRSAPVPIVPMRIQSVKGRPVPRSLGRHRPLATATSPARNGWAFRREYRSTYRDTLVASERLVDGPVVDAGAGRRRRSRSSREVARRARRRPSATTIVWDVQGVPVTTRVASLREVDWARFEPNFFVVFAPGRAGGGAAVARDAHPGRAARPIAGALPAAAGRAISQRHHARPVVGAGDAGGADRPRGARHPVHGPLHPRHGRAGAGRRARHQPVPARPGGRAAPDARRHPRAALPDRARRVPLARRSWRRSRRWCSRSLAAWALARFVFEGDFTPALVPLAGTGRGGRRR